MATPRTWERELSKEDRGFMHEESMDDFRAGSYAATAIRADNLYDEHYWALAMFHNATGSRAYIQDIMRSSVCRISKFFDPLISPEEREKYRSENKVISYHETNYMESARSENAKSGIDHAMSMRSLILEVEEHESLTPEVSAALGYFLILNDGYMHFGPKFWEEFKVIGPIVAKLAAATAGSDNSDKWLNDTKVRMYKAGVMEAFGLTKASLARGVRDLGVIMREIIRSDDI